ncbi:hypothetical protein FMEXI_929 [Fusarium mexicanum]|uniref:Uncharacterized protein n=1 Tax=Fusarium mexicanum TaxID=751941 RepID=A0A8H5JPI9_9HYPO|nr:hypothetical protein FMEXI_929 [Fusarium mexicanum]
MAESQIRPLFESHPDIYQRFLDQFDYTVRHLNDPIRCRRGRAPSSILLSRMLKFGIQTNDTWRHEILPELIDLSDDAGKEKRVGQLKYSPLASPWHSEDEDSIDPVPLRPTTIEDYFRSLKPFQLEEYYSLHYIMLRKFSGDHNMGYEEAHKEAYNRTSEQYWEWRNRTVCREYMQLTITRRDEAITARSEPTSDYEIESEDGMDIDDEDVAWSPVDEMFGLEVYGEPQGWLQKSKKRLFDDDDEANYDVTNKRGKFTHW